MARDKGTSKRTRRRTAAPRSSWTRRPVLGALALALAGVGLALAASVLVRPSDGVATGTPWARLGTQDVHALRFVPGSTERLLFGHHDGLLASADGGRDWAPGAALVDAMSLTTPGGDRLVIAGHLVFQESRDGGASWVDLPAELPSLDIHAFAQSALDPDRMWAYLAGGGVYGSADGGVTWTEVFTGDVIALVAVSEAGADVLLGLDPFAGLVRSADGGRTWRVVGKPPTAPVTSFAATPDGRILVLGGPDGLYRSDDRGTTWRQVLASKAVLAAAVSDDGTVVAAVSEDTLFYRSDDGGTTWPGPV